MKQNSENQKPMVENISCILPENEQLGGLFLGNVFGAQNAAILKEYGIRAIITASAETKINHQTDDIPFHLKIDAHDKDEYYIIEHVNDCIHFIEQNRKMTNVYVHCYAGVSRSSAIVAAYLMWKYRWTLEKTLAFLTYKRIVVKPNDGFYNQLKGVETKLNIVGQGVNQAAGINQAKIQKEQTPSIPVSPQMNDVLLMKRPTSTKAPTAQKPQSPPLQLQNFNGNTPMQVGKADPYMIQMQNSNLMRANGHLMNQKYEEKHQYAPHSQIPIPKMLAKRQQEPNSHINSDYYDQPKQKGRKALYNDYMSPEVLPTSPRQNQTQKASLGKMSLSNNRSGINYSASKDNVIQGSIYNTNSSSNGFNANKKSFQSQQKAKTGSRCIIRPKDLPGYKNY